MKPSTLKSALFCILLSGSPVLAQSDEWEFTATGYLWMTDTTLGIGTPLGSVTGDLSFADALDDLEFAAMGSFLASNGTWSVFGDLMYLDLSTGAPTPGGLAFTNVTVDSTTTIFSTLVARRVFENSSSYVDLGAGFRYIDIGNEVRFSGGAAAPFTSRLDSDWTDPLIGGRAVFAIDDKTSATLAADFGGFDDDTESWQVLLTVNYEFNDNWSLRAGYRHLEFENRKGPFDLDVELSGPIIGVAYRF